MIISCVKWGDKFSHKHVNRLYKMCRKNIDDDFTFICHTDNPEGINSDIHIIPLGDYDLETWWWKLCLFKESSDDINIFFDLDVVIQKNITHYKDYVEKDKLRIIKAYWKPWLENTEPLLSTEFDMNINSSVLIWQGNLTKIWNDFILDPEYYMMKYKGIDSYLYFHHSSMLNYFPKGEIYSRLYGYDENNYWTPTGGKMPISLYMMENYNICIFNGWLRKSYKGDYALTDEGYNGFEHYWN